MLNNLGASRPPCFTPFVTQNSVDEELLHCTHIVWLEYQNANFYTVYKGKPRLISLLNRNQWFKRTKASKNVIKTVVFLVFKNFWDYEYTCPRSDAKLKPNCLSLI